MALSGVIPYGVVAVTSLRNDTRVVLEPDSMDVSGDIWLLLGYDYANALAHTGAGTLIVESTREGIAWRTRTVRGVPAPSLFRDAARKIASRTLEGVVPGFVERASIERDGVKVVSAGMLCEINLVARATGDGSTIQER